jgi:hypothetical protein
MKVCDLARIHELGHFRMAKLLGYGVKKICLGERENNYKFYVELDKSPNLLALLLLGISGTSAEWMYFITHPKLVFFHGDTPEVSILDILIMTLNLQNFRRELSDLLKRYYPLLLQTNLCLLDT